MRRLIAMTLEDGCTSLKLECALRELGFVEIGWRVIAHAGLFFIAPVGFTADLSDDLIGFQLMDHLSVTLRADCHIAPSAKRAIDLALELS